MFVSSAMSSATALRLGYATCRASSRRGEHILEPAGCGKTVERTEHVALKDDVIESLVDGLRLGLRAEEFLRFYELLSVHVHILSRASRARARAASHGLRRVIQKIYCYVLYSNLLIRHTPPVPPEALMLTSQAGSRY